MGKCPYCHNELHIEDFFEKSKTTKKGRIRLHHKDFKGEGDGWYNIKMWVCPMCDTILGFSEWHTA